MENYYVNITIADKSYFMEPWPGVHKVWIGGIETTDKLKSHKQILIKIIYKKVKDRPRMIEKSFW